MYLLMIGGILITGLVVILYDFNSLFYEIC